MHKSTSNSGSRLTGVPLDRFMGRYRQSVTVQPMVRKQLAQVARDGCETSQLPAHMLRGRPIVPKIGLIVKVNAQNRSIAKLGPLARWPGQDGEITGSFFAIARICLTNRVPLGRYLLSHRAVDALPPTSQGGTTVRVEAALAVRPDCFYAQADRPSVSVVWVPMVVAKCRC